MAKILVVDEPAWRRILKRNFERLGHEVIEASDLPTGIEQFEKHKTSVDLVWTGLGLGDDRSSYTSLRHLNRDGLGLVQYVRDQDLTIRCVVASGAAESRLSDEERATWRIFRKGQDTLREAFAILNDELAQRPDGTTTLPKPSGTQPR